jgi:exopolysaccharide biosynthesis polyprenyl glycosylphosphotransferase
VLLAAVGAYAPSAVAGAAEHRRVLAAAVLALAAYVPLSAAGATTGAALLLAVVLLLTAATLAGRGLAARVSTRRRTSRVVLVGRDAAVVQLASRLARTPRAGLEVVAVCVPTPGRATALDEIGVPVAGLDEVLEVAGRCGADAVAVTSASETASAYVRRLAWQLEGSGLALLVAPGVEEVTAPRLAVRSVDGVPLLEVALPRFSGGRRVLKGALDRSLAAAALLVLAPVLLVLALAVRLSSPGPVLYRQQRVGRGGQPFTMLKFRSMVVDADQRLAELQARNESDGLLFKMRDDPRVTPVGRWLRRLSLDELPQLLNVLGGSMSLVGPRPPLAAEVGRYDDAVRRRLLVKPGLTGLWQVSGRSDLPWDEAVRLDLRYVENWSLGLDLAILWRTGRAVLARNGAY